jgi:hypothetical protein
VSVQYDILTASVLEVAVVVLIATNDLLTCWSLIPKMNTYSVCKRDMMRIFECKRQKVIASRKIMHREKLYNVYCFFVQMYAHDWCD